MQQVHSQCPDVLSAISDKQGLGWTLISPPGQYKINSQQRAMISIVIRLPISNKFKRNSMQNVDSVHFQQNANISEYCD